MSEPLKDMKGHYHVAPGIPGYGPDGSNGFISATAWDDLSHVLTDELGRLSEDLSEEANTVATEAEEQDNDRGFREAWGILRKSEQFYFLAQEFSPDRMDAPLYRDDKAAWVATMRDLLKRHFGAEEGGHIEVRSNLNLYVWLHQDGSCEHLEDDE